MWHQFPELTAPVSSNLVNALNFLLFDIFLLSVVFHLTADISGRLNDASLRAGRHQRLHISCPPLIGGGLSGTNFWRALVLMSLRVLAFVIVFATNLTITGYSIEIVARRNATVVALGSLENMTHADYISARFRRESCVGTTNTTRYYGELRDGTSCNTNLSLIPPPVEFSKRFVNVSFNATGCVRKKAPYQVADANITIARCDNALLQCSTVKKTTCWGVVHVNHSTSYLCNLGNVQEGWNKNQLCKRAHNLAFKSEYWLGALNFSVESVQSLLDATYGAGSEVRTVQYLINRPLTKIGPLWFVALALKIALVFGLLCTSLGLKVNGYNCRVHDEHQLSMLLRENLGQNYSRREESVYLNAVEGDGYVSVWASTHSGLRERNQSRHMEEALHY